MTGRGRGGRAFLGALVASSAIVIAGCGAESHENDPRPPQAVEVTVAITEKAVTISPAKIATKPGGSTTPISQNQGVENPQTEGNPNQLVVFTVANTTGFDTALEVRGAVDETSGPIVANGTGELKASLPAGSYGIFAADIPGAERALLTVGSDRTSSQNNLLLP